MKIYACIPSLNEVATIESVTQFVDKGLQMFCSKYALSAVVKILNIDSSSDDETVRKFNETNTHFSKQSIILNKPRGKGKNLLEFMRIAYEDEVDYCVTVDADIRSGNPQWINDLLTPLLENQADFVTPLYKRSRFEGSSTNHFAYPVTLALTGVRVRQPIAGDFGFNFALLEVVNKLDIPEGTQYYGIDVFLTLATLMNGLHHKQIDLGLKLHNPSHTKLEYMFPQIAEVELSMLRHLDIKKISLPAKENFVTNITESKVFLHKDVAKKMHRDAVFYLSSADIFYWGWVPDDLIKKLKKDT